MTGAAIWVTAAAGQALQAAILVARPVADLKQAYDGEADQTCKRPPTFTACDLLLLEVQFMCQNKLAHLHGTLLNPSEVGLDHPP